MARGGRKYARDARGRFASVGATARGGRLRTAGGNQRGTVKVKSDRRSERAGAIRATDVRKARASNGFFGSAERRIKAGLNSKAPAAEMRSLKRQAEIVKINRLNAANSRIREKKQKTDALEKKKQRRESRKPRAGTGSRTRSQAAAAQLARSAKLVRRTNRWEGKQGGAMRITKTRTNQGNLLTGKTETVTRRKSRRIASVLDRRAPSSPLPRR